MSTENPVWRKRASLLRDIREFFYAEQFLEVDTPALTPSIIPEPTIDIFTTNPHLPHETEMSGVETRQDSLYLLPSPEKWLKRLMCSGESRIYQMSHAFRRCEPRSGIHSPEFMLLEWYAAESDYVNELERTIRLLRNITGDNEVLSSEPLVLTVNESFIRYAHIDLTESTTIDSFRTRLDHLGIEYASSDSWSDLFHRILIEYVEPAMRSIPVVILTDYPLEVRCLARQKPGTMWRERWELYLQGMEIANCYTEETNAGEIKTLFEQEGNDFGDRTETIDFELAEIHNQSPQIYSGVALGFDRLLMAFGGLKRIEDAAYFIDELYKS